MTVEREAASSAEALVPRPEAGAGKPGAGTAPGAPELPSITVSNRAELVSAVLVQMALRWLVDPNREWPRLAAKPDAPPAGPEPVILPEFIVSLLSEIQEGVVLERLDWEHVAGHRFSSVVMQPTLVRYVTRTGIVTATLVLILDAFYFFGFYRLRRWMKRKRLEAAEKAKPPGGEANGPPH
jgi:hypothetical protein